MRAIRLLLCVFSYLFHGLLAVLLLGISGLALSSSSPKLSLRMLPWTGETLTYILFFGSLFGLLTLILALGGKAPILFFVWSLVVAVLLTKGYVFSTYYFARGEFRMAAGLLLASWIAVVGAWPRRRRRRWE